jgi:hypothetical protein
MARRDAMTSLIERLTIRDRPLTGQPMQERYRDACQLLLLIA